MTRAQRRARRAVDFTLFRLCSMLSATAIAGELPYHALSPFNPGDADPPLLPEVHRPPRRPSCRLLFAAVSYHGADGRRFFVQSLSLIDTAHERVYSLDAYRSVISSFRFINHALTSWLHV